MSATILTKNLVSLCDGGQCGGEVAITTDDLSEAYATVTTDPSTRYRGRDCESVERLSDGSIVVHCNAVIVEADQVCDGTATFTRADLDTTSYAVAAEAAYMIPMEMDA